jgi:hypothetical protein
LQVLSDSKVVKVFKEQLVDKELRARLVLQVLLVLLEYKDFQVDKEHKVLLVGKELKVQ